MEVKLKNDREIDEDEIPMNRASLREFERMSKRKVGNFTKPSLKKRTEKRRKVKKVGNETRRLARA